MTRDEKLIYEGYKDLLKKAALPLTAAAIGYAGAQALKQNSSEDEIVKDKVAHASSIFQSSVVLSDMPIKDAAKLFVDYTHDIPIEDYKDLRETLIRFSETLPHLQDRKKADELQDEIDFAIKEKQIDLWANKDEDAEKVTTEPYLNNANNEEVLTQYKQSWQGAGGGFGKGYGTKGGTRIPNALD